MSEPTSIPSSKAGIAIARAKSEIADEQMQKRVATLKSKLRERGEAQRVLNNIDREIADLELQIEQGSL